MRKRAISVVAVAVAATVAAGVAVTAETAGAGATSAVSAISTKPYHVTANYSKYNSLLAALKKKLPVTPVHSVMNDANLKRQGFHGSVPLKKPVHGFGFNDADNGDHCSYPQGVTTSRDAIGSANSGNYDGHQLIAVSWYTKGNCNSGKNARSRLTLVDWDATYDNKYRKILFVEPTGSASKPSFKDVPVHAGGVVWFGDYLYLADTSHGLRVFNMKSILKVSTNGSAAAIGRQSNGSYQAHNYKYVLPQVGTITDTSTGTGLNWSTISLDRPSHSLVMTEYTCKSCSDYPKRKPRAIRFPFAKGKTTFAGKTNASQALSLGVYNLNGVGSHNGRWWFNSSAKHTLYYWTKKTGLKSHAWVSSGESISYWEDPKKPDQLVSLQEGVGHRNVFLVEQAKYS